MEAFYSGGKVRTRQTPPFPNNLTKIKLRGKPEEFQIKPTQRPQDSSETALSSVFGTLLIKGNHVLKVEATDARQDPE